MPHVLSQLTHRWSETTLLLALALAIHSPALAGTCNSVPVAGDDTVDYLGRSVIVDVLANDFDLDGEALTVISVSAGTCNGTPTVDFGLVKMVPPVASSAQCVLSYQVADEAGGTATAEVTVRVVSLIFQDDFESGDASNWEVE